MNELLIKGTIDTLYIVSMSTLFALFGGLPIGVLLVIWKKDGIAPFILTKNMRRLPASNAVFVTDI